jgi:hypothetical protein
MFLTKMRQIFLEPPVEYFILTKEIIIIVVNMDNLKMMDFRIARFFVEHHVNNCAPPLEGISMREGVICQGKVSGLYC